MAVVAATARGRSWSMRCPQCGGEEDKVVDSRVIREGRAVRRRRECESCQTRFTTYEYVEFRPTLVIKRDGRRLPYDRAKIMAGLTKACVKRPVTLEQIETMVEEIERQLVERHAQEVPTQAIGQAVMKRLQSFDEVAYVRYASVYHSFDSLDEFMAVLDSLKAAKDDAT
jgi:transcriptional repressor NrdR